MSLAAWLFVIGLGLLALGSACVLCVRYGGPDDEPPDYGAYR